jgi:hypothetical protein
MLVEELVTYLFDGRPHILAEAVGSWLASSRRFSAFVTRFRDKIRKKLRVTQDQETLYDLRLELETAYLLLQERSLSLVYEPEQAQRKRSPDFAVTFTSSLTFMVEVTRLRRTGTQTEDERLADAICTKLGQLLPQRSNVLIVGVNAFRLESRDLQAIMLRIQQRAERSDSPFWERYGFRERADFFRHYQRLSEVLLRGSPWQADQPLIVWVNPQAKYPLPGKVRTALHRSLSITQ